MSDDLLARRHDRAKADVRRATRSSAAVPPGWTTRFVIPQDACESCARHYHHRCHGVNVLLEPVPDCPCDCGDQRDPMLLNVRAWADLAIYAPEQVWVAAMFERQRAAGINMCTWRNDGSGLSAAKESS